MIYHPNYKAVSKAIYVHEFVHVTFVFTLKKLAYVYYVRKIFKALHVFFFFHTI